MAGLLPMLQTPEYASHCQKVGGSRYRSKDHPEYLLRLGFLCGMKDLETEEGLSLWEERERASLIDKSQISRAVEGRTSTNASGRKSSPTMVKTIRALLSCQAFRFPSRDMVAALSDWLVALRDSSATMTDCMLSSYSLS